MTQRTHNTRWHRWWRLSLAIAAGSAALLAAVLWSRHGAWWQLAPAVAQDVGDSASEAVGMEGPDGVTVEGDRPGAQPFREPPRLLSEAEVTQGLVARHQALRQRFVAQQERRRQAPAEDSAVPMDVALPADAALPKLPPNAHVPPRPDARGGEFDQDGVQ